MAYDFVAKGTMDSSGITKGAKSAKDSIEGLKSKVEDAKRKFESLGTSGQSLTGKLSTVRSAMMKLADAGQQDTDLFRKMAQAAAQYRDKLNSVNSAIDSYSTKANKAKSSSTDMLSSFSSSLGLGSLSQFTTLAGAGAASAAAMGLVLYQAASKSSEFGRAISELGGITGQSGDALNSLRDIIIKVGQDTRVSTTDIAQNFAQIGSALPQLLKDQEGLEAVSRAAITLSKAGVMPLSDATNSLTTSLAQFSLSSGDASHVIDVLANASRMGAADIGSVAETLARCGTSASSAGVNISQAAALTEVLASKSIKGAEAGTQLRNVFTRMQTKGVEELNPKVVGLQTALENLAAHATDTSYLVKIFGEESSTAASIIGQNMGFYEELVNNIDNVGAASEQARTNTNNLASDFEEMSNHWNNFLSSFNTDTDNSPLRALIQGCDELIGELESMVTYVQSHSNAFDNMGSSATQVINEMVETFRLVIQIVGEVITIIEQCFSTATTQGSVVTTTLKAINEVLFWIKAAFYGIQEAVGYVQQKWGEFTSSIRGAVGNIPLFDYMETALDKIASAINKVIGWYKDLKKTVGMAMDEQDKATSNTIKNQQKQAKVTQNTTVTTNITPTVTTTKGKIDKKAIKIPKDITVPVGLDFSQSRSLSTISDYQHEIQYLTKAMNAEADLTQIQKYGEQIDFLQQKIKELKEVASGVRDENGIIKFDADGSGLKELNEQFLKTQETLNKTIGEDTRKNIQSFGDAIGNLSSGFSSLGSAIDGTSGKILTIAGATMSAVSQMIPQILSLIGAKEGEALASGVASAAKLGWPQNLAAIASIVSQVMALFATIKSTAGFATGGIVGGSSYYGDNMYIRANSGEMVLTKSQQANLFNAINSGRLGSNGGATEITWKLKGSDLYGSLKNFTTKQSHIR